MTSDKAQIEKLITDYLDGLYHCNVDLLATVFHPQARYATAAGAEPLILDMDVYLPMVAKREAPAKSDAPRSEEIFFIDFAGPTAALVKLRCSFFQRDYVDLLTLIKVKDRWQIIAKVFHFDEIGGEKAVVKKPE